MEVDTAYGKLIALLEEGCAQYRVIDHAPEGRTELVSAMRGHDPKEAAKCIILLVKIGKKVTQFVLAVIPGTSKVDFEAVKALKRATFVRFAELTLAETLAGSVSGTILPFAFDPKLELIVDPEVAGSDVMYFNAGRLDRSLALATRDYLRIAKPRVAAISAPPA